MRKAQLMMVLLLVLCFGLVGWLQPRYLARVDEGNSSSSALAHLLGDGRQMAADYAFVEADVYFHSGYYPSIFDQARRQEESDSDVSHPEEGNGQKEKGFMGEPLDWIDRFSRHFRPAEHTHLQGQKVREILPWIKLSAELDPHRIQTYVVAAYWLRDRLNKSSEAEEFLREGLKENPHSPDLLYVLGQIYLQDRKDLPRARNLFTAALRCWYEVEQPKPVKAETSEGQRDYLLLEQILGGLVKDELAAGHLNQALDYMKQLKANASDPEGVQKQIDELQARINAGAGGRILTPPRSAE